MIQNPKIGIDHIDLLHIYIYIYSCDGSRSISKEFMHCKSLNKMRVDYDQSLCVCVCMGHMIFGVCAMAISDLREIQYIIGVALLHAHLHRILIKARRSSCNWSLILFIHHIVWMIVLGYRCWNCSREQVLETTTIAENWDPLIPSGGLNSVVTVKSDTDSVHLVGCII